MKMCLAALVACCSLFWAGRADAQVTEGKLRLSLDTTLFSYLSGRVKADAGGQDYLSKTDFTNFGTNAPLFGGGGLALGYVASEYAIPGLYLGFGRTKLTQEEEVDGDEVGDSEQTLTQLEVRPHVEIPFAPDQTFVPYGMLGFSYVHRWEGSDDDVESDADRGGFGPSLGLGAHAFAAEKVSFDLGLTFRALFMQDDDTEEALEDAGFEDVKQREYLIALTIGASFWL